MDNNMRENRKALFFDIDGTILSEETKMIPHSAVDAIQAARKAGHLTFINTGRTRACLPDKIKDVEFDGILCGCGTELIFHGESIMHQSLDRQLCCQIAEAVRNAGVGAILEGESFYFNVPDRPAFRFLKTGGGLKEEARMDLVFEWEPEDTAFDKFVYWSDEKSDQKELVKLIQPVMDIMVRGKNFYEIVPKGYTKAKAIQIVQEMFHIDLVNTYVFGDSSNDLSMFKYSPNAIAMGKHDPVLDPYTSYVTDTVENDGIWKAMKALKLI